MLGMAPSSWTLNVAKPRTAGRKARSPAAMVEITVYVVRDGVAESGMVKGAAPETRTEVMADRRECA